MLKIINILFYAVFVTLLLAIAGLLIGSMLPIPGNIELKIVKSGSMEPTIPTGSLVVVKPMSHYSINDVITFGADTKTEIPTTHRIIAFEGVEGKTVYRTKGDANEDQDANPVAREEVIGKVVFHAPLVGFVLDFARQPLGFMLLIGVPAALVILEEVLAITREVKAALRRRRKDGNHDDDDSTGTILREVAKERVVYLRRRSMDEIFVPMMANTSTWIQEKVPMPKDAYASATLAVIGIVSVSTLMSGGANGTIAYFQDLEKSAGNFFQAGSGPDFLDQREPAPEIETQLLRTAVVDEESEGEVAGKSTEAPPEETIDEADETNQEPQEPQEIEEPTGSGGGASEPTEPVADEVPAETLVEEPAAVEPEPTPEPEAVDEPIEEPEETPEVIETDPEPAPNPETVS